MVYFIIVSVIAILMTLYDKFASKYMRRARIPEATLLLTSCAGGSIAMLITMLFIRHKTRKYKFMLGIPAIIILQIVALAITKKFSLL